MLQLLHDKKQIQIWASLERMGLKSEPALLELQSSKVFVLVLRYFCHSLSPLLEIARVLGFGRIVGLPQPLKDRFPRLFNPTLRKKSPISKFVSPSYDWNLHLC